jgi:hypothetical protein
MRTEKELLIIIQDWMQENFEYEGMSGICQSMYFIEACYGLITEKEYVVLRDKIQICLPNKTINERFCWQPRLLKPRIEFINKLIENYE